MSDHLLLIAIGPVQDFIVQARRTRDLWYGSHLLSELSRTAARTLADGGANLIFPALSKGDAQLENCLAPLRQTGEPPTSIANKVLAEVPSELDPEDLARDVRECVMTYWREKIAASVKKKCASLLVDDIDSSWNEQVETFVEFTACWSPLGDGDYAETRRRLEQTIAGRKVLRDFTQWTQMRGAVPKSSLDGARETVLLCPQERDVALAHKYRIADGEQLDAVGLIKRAGGEPDQFVPILNIALASWLECVSSVAPDELERLRGACNDLGVSRVSRCDLPCVKPFPFDASVLISSRWPSVFQEQRLEGDPARWGREYVNPILRRISEPYPYVACLVADGDRLGRAIDDIDSSDAHRQFSAALAGFANTARDIVERHKGVLVYAGGDDVLAFVPIPEVLSCAQELRMGFRAVMAPGCVPTANVERPTLSIGIGVGHVMDGMGHLLNLGRDAEREAKRDRNSLAIIVDKRSGGLRKWKASWLDNPVDSLTKAVELLHQRLPVGKVYEITRFLFELPESVPTSDHEWLRVLVQEIRRILTRVEVGPLNPEDVDLIIDEDSTYKESYANATAWIERMLIARTLSEATPRVFTHREVEAII